MRWLTREPEREDSTTWTLRRGELGEDLMRTNMERNDRPGCKKSNRYKPLTRHYIRANQQKHPTSPMTASGWGLEKCGSRGYRRTVGDAMAIQGLRQALRRRKATPAEIARAAEAAGVWATMEPYVMALTSDA